jgi:uncharacterized protein YqjF (DUF2071 family)
VTARRALPWLFEQTEADQLFLSWPVAPPALADRIPPPLALDTFDGSAWITLVAFRIERLRLRGIPPVPGLSRFAEVSCLTHVRLGDERGVWFVRIDASTLLGSMVGGVLYALPYHRSAVTVGADGEWRSVGSEGQAPDGRVAPVLRARYRAIGREAQARPGTLAHFVLEQTVMFSRTPRGTLLRGVQARARRLARECELVVERNTMPAAAGLPGPGREVATWFCDRTVVRTGPPARITAAAGR